MGDVLGLGLTHWPPLNGNTERMTTALKFTINDPGLPEPYRTPAGWPEQMRAEWGADEGLSAATRHRDALVAEFRGMRTALDEFAPDVVIVWGDDQYENFQEDIIPPFCVLAYDTMEIKPWHGRAMRLFGQNAWAEPEDKTFVFRGAPNIGKALVSSLLESGFDMSYAYQPLHYDGLPHPFVNTYLFLDYDRKGIDYPLVPIQVNCYGRVVIAQHGGFPKLTEPVTGDKFDPPSPAPWRCFDLGRAIARWANDSPWRVALIASASWSHAFLTAKNHWIYPDHDADRALYRALEDADWTTWRDWTLQQIEDSGQQELLNWHCLAGAMCELGRKPSYTSYFESWILNSNKAFAIFNA